jgi:hypothetical protein
MAIKFDKNEFQKKIKIFQLENNPVFQDNDFYVAMQKIFNLFNKEAKVHLFNMILLYEKKLQLRSSYEEYIKDLNLIYNLHINDKLKFNLD